MYELRSLWQSDLRSITALALVLVLAAVAAAPVAAQTSGDESTDTSSSDSETDESDDDDDGIDEWENDILKSTGVAGAGGVLTGIGRALLRYLGLSVERPAAGPPGSARRHDG